jgi:hypothetical protein
VKVLNPGPFLGISLPSGPFILLVQKLSSEPQPSHTPAFPAACTAGSLERQPSFIAISSFPLLLFLNLSGTELIKFRVRNRPNPLFHKN